MTTTPVSTESLEVQVVIDAGRFGGSRIRNMSTGWSEALTAVGALNPFVLPLACSLMTTAELVAGSLPFAQMPEDARTSAEAISRRGQELASRREAGLAKVDDPSTFARSLAQSCTTIGKGAPAYRRRLVAVYRTGFSEAGSPDERMILEELSAHSPRDIMVLLVGQRLSGTPSGCARLWGLPVEALRSPSTVATHAWSVLECCTGKWWGYSPRAPSDRVGSRLVCDSCGSASEWQETGDHCSVCHMGHMRTSAHTH